MLGFLWRWGGLVKVSHTVFALPFALASMVVAARADRGWPGWRVFGLILLAMVSGRTCAMVFNRIVDRHYDRLNPRTARRHLPAGEVSLAGAWILWAVSAVGLVLAAGLLNPVCLVLSPIALVVICGYSLTKRFTDFTHVYLGVALALAPIGAWLAVRGDCNGGPPSRVGSCRWSSAPRSCFGSRASTSFTPSRTGSSTGHTASVRWSCAGDRPTPSRPRSSPTC
jgi:4-hydroxybenzoate polyprenyltransferase